VDRWTLPELEERVADALAAGGYVPPSNGQVRALPDARTIRYYTTLGLLDRPAETRGRTALYRHRHLLQICAIKRLQAEGLPLGLIQARLTGLDDVALALIARVDALPRAPRAPARDDRFWAVAPAPIPAAEPSAAAAMARTAAAAAPAPALTTMTRIVLATGVELFVGGVVRDARALARAAAPLIEELRRQTRPEDET
jgi:DNA-binding transcriptional MerR regulator